MNDNRRKKSKTCDDAMIKESMCYTNKSWKKNQRNNRINFSKLRRFINSKVGSNWNEVYSGICQKFSEHSAFDIKEWLEIIVDIKCTIKDGVIYNAEFRDVYRAYSYGYYVHPETNILCKIVKPALKTPRKKKKVFKLDKALYYLHSDGMWYRVEMEESQFDDNQNYFIEMLHWFRKDKFMYNQIGFDARICSSMAHDMYGYSPNRKMWICVKRESASTREIKKLKEKYGI